MVDYGMYLNKKSDHLRGLTPVQLIVSGYLIFAVIGTVLLSLPFSLQPGVNLSLIDALFTSTSAISVTGLTVVNTADTFSLAGLAILVFLLQFGGIGIMTLGTLVFVLMGNQVNLRNRMMIMADQNQTSMQGMVILMLFIFKVAIILEILGTLFLTAYFWAYYDMQVWKALGMGFFHSVSGFTNAGFDLFGNSLQGFRQDYVLQSVMGILLLAGSIGFPVLLELHSYLSAKRTGRVYRFTLYTKLTTITFIALLVVGFVIVLFSEMSGALAGAPWHQKISTALFHSLNTRNGGFSTVDVSVFHDVTLLFFCLLMFIGASPSSCGGGIRTTTFAVLLLSLAASFRGQSSVKVFRRELYDADVIRAFSVFVVASLLVFSSVIIMLGFERLPAIQIIFEACSAFGTTGLSTGITGELSTPGKAVITFLMFIGRIGIVALILVFHNKRADQNYHFVKEKIIIG